VRTCHTRFTKPNVASALDALLLAGLVKARPVGNERRYSLPAKVPILPGLHSPVAQPDWVRRFGIALEVHRFLSRNDTSATVRAVDGRRLLDSPSDRIATEGAPAPYLDGVGEEHAGTVDRWVIYLVDRLRAPSRP
jgi:hypothetical protein